MAQPPPAEAEATATPEAAKHGEAVSSITNDRLTTPGATTGKAIAMSIVFGG